MDSTFNEEIIIEFDGNAQEAKVSASKTFADLAMHIGSSGLFTTKSKTNYPGTDNNYNINTITLSDVFSDYILYKNILIFLNSRHLEILKEDPIQSKDDKKVRISILLKNCNIHKP